MTQNQHILQFIKNNNNSITSMQAFKLGITRLSARIYELRQLGYIFINENITKKNRYGHYVTFSNYKLKKKGSRI